MRAIALFFTVAAVLGVRVAALADDATATALLAKHYAYVGWQYGDGRVPTMRISEHTSLNKSGELKRRSRSIELVEGLIYRDTTVSGNGESEEEGDTGFTGHVFWSSNVNGFTVPERGDGIKDRIARQVVFYEATTTLPATVRKDDTIDGTPVTILRETIPHAYPIDIYVDPTTDAYERVVFDPSGVDGRFILDIGSSAIAFTDSFRRRIHSREISHSRATGIAGQISTIVQRVDTIAFADGSVLNDVIVESGVAEDNEIDDGLMGFDFLGGAIVDLNLDKATIHLSDPATTTPSSAGGYVFSADLSGLTPIIPVVLGGTARSDVLLDSGNPTFALIASDYLSRVRVLVDNGNLASQMAIGGVSGGYEVDRCARLSNISMGSISYDGVFACFSHSVSDREGIVGFDFIKHFNITFDYPDGKMIFFPRK